MNIVISILHDLQSSVQLINVTPHKMKHAEKIIILSKNALNQCPEIINN